jgi:hypothetical protein
MKKNFLKYAFFCAVGGSCAQASLLQKISPQAFEKIKAFLSPVSFSKVAHIFPSDLLLEVQTRDQKFSDFQAFVQSIPKKRNALKDEGGPHEKKLAYKTKRLSEAFLHSDWRSYIAHHFDHPDVLFSRVRTTFFIESYLKKDRLILATLKNKPVFLNLYPALMQHYSLDVFKRFLQHPSVFFLITPQFLSEEKDFFSLKPLVERVKGIVSGSSGNAAFGERLVSETEIQIREAPFDHRVQHFTEATQNRLSLKQSEFLMLVEGQKLFLERFPDFWSYVLGLDFQKNSPVFLERKECFEALSRCRFLSSFSWRFGTNIYGSYELFPQLKGNSKVRLLKQADPQKTPVFYLYECLAQRGRELCVQVLPKMRHLKKLHLSDWFFKKDIGMWCDQSLQNLFLLPALQDLVLPVSMFQYKKFFSTVLSGFDSPEKGQKSFLRKLRFLALNFEYEPSDHAKKEARKLQEKFFNQSFYQMKSKKTASLKISEGFKELFFFLTHPWIRKSVQNLFVEGVCFQPQNCFHLGDFQDVFLGQESAKAWLKSYSPQHSFFFSELKQKSNESFDTVPDFLKHALSINYHFPSVLGKLSHLRSAFFSQVYAHQLDSIDKEAVIVSAWEPGFQFKNKDFFNHVGQGIKSWIQSVLKLPFFNRLESQDERLVSFFSSCSLGSISFFEQNPSFFQKTQLCFQNMKNDRTFCLNNVFSDFKIGFYEVMGQRYGELSYPTQQKREHFFEFVQKTSLQGFLKIETMVLDGSLDYLLMARDLKEHAVRESLGFVLMHDRSDLLGEEMGWGDENSNEKPRSDYGLFDEIWNEQGYYEFAQSLSGVRGLSYLNIVFETESVLALLIQHFPTCLLAQLKGPTAIQPVFKALIRQKISKEKCPTLIYNDHFI